MGSLASDLIRCQNHLWMKSNDDMLDLWNHAGFILDDGFFDEYIRQEKSLIPTPTSDYIADLNNMKKKWVDRRASSIKKETVRVPIWKFDGHNRVL